MNVVALAKPAQTRRLKLFQEGLRMELIQELQESLKKLQEFFK
jgi:hypothetical protein